MSWKNDHGVFDDDDLVGDNDDDVAGDDYYVLVVHELMRLPHVLLEKNF